MAQTLIDRFRGKSSAPAAEAERRRSIRHTTVFQVARASTDTWQELCILRNVSPGGLKAEIYMPVEVGERMTVEIKTGHSLQGRVVWTNEQFVGLQFDAEVPMMAMLAHCSADERVGRIRPPRIDVDLPSKLRLDHDEMLVRVNNISQAGMRMAVDAPLRVDARCEIRLDELGWKRACVRWCRDGEAGLMLVQPLLYPEFAAWRRALHQIG